MYKIGIVGYGYVGRGMHRLFGDWVHAIYDPNINFSMASHDFNFDAKRIGKGLNDKVAFGGCDLAIVCVPTPSKKDGSCDASIVEETIKWLRDISAQDHDLLILVKSAVVPSEAERIKDKYGVRLVMSPEYLGEGKYFVPFWKYPDPKEVKYHTFQVFGGDPKDTSECVDIFIAKMGPHVKFHQGTLKEAAYCKYMENSWGAQKVIFANTWRKICEAGGVDYNKVREMWAADSRVERMHTAVFPKARGYGGKCFPKDVKAIIAEARKTGYDPELLVAVDRVNKKLRKK